MLGAFSAAAVIPSFETFVQEFDITITQASYFVSVPIIFLGMFAADFTVYWNGRISIADLCSSDCTECRCFPAAVESDQQADRSTPRSRELLPFYGAEIFHLVRAWLPVALWSRERSPLTDFRTG